MSTDPKPNHVSVAARFARPIWPDSGRPASAETIERNVALARTFVERVLGQGDMAAFDAIVADDVWVSTGLKPDAPVLGKEDYRSVLGSTLGVALRGDTATMDVHEVVPTLDGRVLVRFTAQADHVGELDGIAPTGKRLTLSETHFLAFRDGKLVESYVGALNPLHWEMLYAPVIAPKVL